MNNYIFQLAEENDDAELRDILKNNPMDGEFCLAFQRDPYFFHAVKAGTRFSQVMIVKERRNDKIVGLGTRAIISAYINGGKCNLGYLSNLRLDENYRDSTLLSRGYKYLKTLHQDKKTAVYITTIIEDNKYAANLLTSQRTGLPVYHDFGTYHSVAIVLSGKKKKMNSEFKIMRGSKEMLGEILDCIKRNGSEKQFYPSWTKEDFASDTDILRDFKIEDFYIVLKNDKVVGVMAKWDQSNFKQTIVTAYKGRWKIIKPFYNLGASIFGYPFLPKPNFPMNFFYVCFIAIDSNNLQIFQDLLRVIYNDSVNSGYSYFLMGLHSNDPLLKVLKEYHCITYKSRLYIVYWEDGESFFRSIDNRVPYLEISML